MRRGCRRAGTDSVLGAGLSKAAMISPGYRRPRAPPGGTARAAITYLVTNGSVPAPRPRRTAAILAALSVLAG
ncbi:hypothetical protein G6F60_015709 [Rhizopus arrhizus]|nr:hypothetical protein G6F60_015709 [Rhizopus arrhizus]